MPIILFRLNNELQLSVVKMHRSGVVVLVVLCFIVPMRCSLRKDADYWTKLAVDELEEALNVKWNVGVAKNVILFIGDGMGPNTVTATRIYKGGESHRLAYEMFPHVGLLKTYSADKMVPDSASTATALLCGVKVNQNTVGVDSSAKHKDCKASLNPKAQLDSLAALALRAGKSAGFVTTMRVTHATPGPVYAHSAARTWECDSDMPTGTEKCKDIARQLVEDWPGRDLNVIMGGGRQGLMSNCTGTPSDPISSWACSRSDGRNLIKEYKADKQRRGLKYSIVSNNRELKKFNVNKTDYLLGIFANEHLRYESERDKGPDGMPSISDMVEAAVKVLQRNSKGFFLMVEGGNIDMAHHRGRAKVAINESSAMEEAVKLAVKMTDEKDTLIVVTSDHAHSLQINGYPDRGISIFGTTGPSKYDNLNYTILSYGTGGPGSFQYSIETNATGGHIVRKDPNKVDTESFKYEQVSAIPLDENIHGGVDVAIYARGPYAHLFHNVHEQNYVFHAICYAANIGSYSIGTTGYAKQERRTRKKGQ
ncbi:alkaline phosphatase isoform X2 [Bicyclus anynana]|uniref:Alkaline phosphatase n=1 Tax=Bicyclus anynana TaxID=110368 RepID=A0A6J1NYV7_BICAN|nr:alkaline phosphatase isoform X2 [Bicyclus anynana]